MPRYKDDEKEQVRSETRRKLMQAAAKEFADRGFEAANVNRISMSAGFAKGTIYNYFPSKRDLMLAFIDEVGQMHVDYIRDRVRQEESPRRRLETFYVAGFGFVMTYFSEAWAIYGALNGPDLEFKLRLSQVYEPLFRLLGEEILAPGIAQGEFREVDTGYPTAGLLMLIYLGTSSQLTPDGKHWLDPRQVADFVLHALRK